MFIAFLLAHAVDNRVPRTFVTTANSLDSFARCFTERQEQERRAWWFVPNDTGGTFSNEGVPGAGAIYKFVFRAGVPNKIKFEGHAEGLSLITDAVNACSRQQ